MAVVAPSDLVSDEVPSSLGRPVVGGLIGSALGGQQGRAEEAGRSAAVKETFSLVQLAKTTPHGPVKSRGR